MRALLFLIVLSVALPARAVPDVFRIEASQCVGRSPSEARHLSGFRARRFVGIVTALHGVAGCRSITAKDADSGKTFVQLEVRQMDSALDLALLGSAALDSEGSRGLGSAGMPTDPVPLRVIGYPHGLQQQLITSLASRGATRLGALVPPGQGYRRELLARKSPDVDSEVLSVEGHLTMGHSGAPILNTSGNVVAVANGGLEKGAIEIAWGVPLSKVAFVADPLRLNELAGRDPGLLFSLDRGIHEDQGTTCFGAHLDLIRRAGSSELLATVDDPLSLSQLSFFYGLSNAAVDFDIYRDPGATTTLVVPAGWPVRPTENGCVATSPGNYVEILYWSKLLPGAVSSLLDTNALTLARERAVFCNQSFVVDSTMSNPVARTLPYDGLITQRRSYYQIEFEKLRCASPATIPGLLEQSWPVLGAPSRSPAGYFQCYPLCPQGLVVYRRPSEQSEPHAAVGFGSYLINARRVLSVTMKLTDSAHIRETSSCTAQLSRTPACRAAYERHRLWGSAVLSATACGISGD